MKLSNNAVSSIGNYCLPVDFVRTSSTGFSFNSTHNITWGCNSGSTVPVPIACNGTDSSACPNNGCCSTRAADFNYMNYNVYSDSVCVDNTL